MCVELPACECVRPTFFPLFSLFACLSVDCSVLFHHPLIPSFSFSLFPPIAFSLCFSFFVCCRICSDEMMSCSCVCAVFVVCRFVGVCILLVFLFFPCLFVFLFASARVLDTPRSHTHYTHLSCFLSFTVTPICLLRS